MLLRRRAATTDLATRVGGVSPALDRADSYLLTASVDEDDMDTLRFKDVELRVEGKLASADLDSACSLSPDAS